MATLAPSRPRPDLERTASGRGMLQHVRVGPLAVLDGGLHDATAFCLEAIGSGSGARVATANLDFVALARHDAQLREDLARSSLVVADGAPVAWLARAAGATRVSRITGVDLVARLLEEGAAQGGLRVAMYGGEEAVSEAAAAAIEADHPGVRVVARICPPYRELTEEERQSERAALRAAAPDLVLVALGCPKQERLIAEYGDAVPAAVWIGVGGTFDFFAGKRRRAPRALQATGLEWAVRLVQEPARLWRRYLLRDLPALAAVAPGCFAARVRREGRTPERHPA